MEELYPEIFSGYLNTVFEMFSCVLLLIVGMDLQFAVIKTINEDKVRCVECMFFELFFCFKITNSLSVMIKLTSNCSLEQVLSLAPK